MAAQDDVEARVSQLIAQLAKDFAHLGAELRPTLVRALIHRAVHFASEAPGMEFCTLATYLADMVGHAHRLAHGENPKAPSHKDLVH
jgi:hypothetical protein